MRKVTPLCLATFTFLSQSMIQAEEPIRLASRFDKIEQLWVTGLAGSFEGVDSVDSDEYVRASERRRRRIKEIRYRKFEVENQKGAIVISSGRTECMLKYKEVVFELTKEGYSVYIFDHRGQGFSDRLTRHRF